MRVPRKINVSLQTFNAWQHRKVIDENVKASNVQNAYSVYWQDPNTSFTPHTVTVTSGEYAAAATANDPVRGML